ncbi:TPA: hypothetical protein NHR53_005583 [Pseudomonas aeruginosa]|nr:hypothetical protein [Pseudomonas aeruginosa]HCE8128997.1 hypothetical protein [Pseudomonas aeruginosa]HCF0446784.1 hypothetical protein [Pseudomonas aeruginosa]
MQNQLVPTQVTELVVGNRVDLESCPYLTGSPYAANAYGIVSSVDKETESCVAVGYEDIDVLGYPADTVLMVKAPQDVPDPIVEVRSIACDDDWVEWRISQNLTDRWGEINSYNAENKPLELLEFNQPLFERLLQQMWGEDTFVVRKDGHFGILFEFEMYSLESDGHPAEPGTDAEPENNLNLRPAEEVIAYLKTELKEIAPRFPGVELCIPSEAEICNGRPAVWAFVRDGLLTDDQRDALGTALASL